LENRKYTFGACYNKMVMEKVNVEEKKPTKNYIKLVLAPDMGQGNNAENSHRESGTFFLKLSCKPVIQLLQSTLF